MLLALAAYLKLVTSQLFYPILAFTAQGTALLLNSFGAQVEVSGAALSSNNFSMNMVAECTAIIPIVIFFCAVVAYPSGGKEKASGIAIGILALTVLNLIRTSSLFYIGSTFPDFLDIAHYLVWQSLMILAAIFLWLFWVEKITRVP
jgi:exosortase H (IPTLxxWG-CTERM-specific)